MEDKPMCGIMECAKRAGDSGRRERRMAKSVAVALSLASLLGALFMNVYAQGGPPQGEQGNGFGREAKFLQVTIAPVGTDPDTPKGQFQKGETVYVLLSMTNTGDEPMTVAAGDPFYQSRVQLLKDGKPVPYKRQVLELLRSKEKRGASGGDGVMTINLQPKRATRVRYFDLADWFGQLEPGHYQLTVRHRFRGKGKLIESNAVTFDVLQ
jgi:hypothetical protein